MPVLVQISSDILWTVSYSECDLLLVMNSSWQLYILYRHLQWCSVNVVCVFNNYCRLSLFPNVVDCFRPKPNVCRKCPFVHIRHQNWNRSRNSADL